MRLIPPAVASVTLAPSASIASLADVSVAATTTAVVLAANTSRDKAIISNLSSNPREVRIGDSGAGAAEGIELLPGERIELDTTAAIYAYNPHSGAMTLAVAELTS